VKKIIYYNRSWRGESIKELTVQEAVEKLIDDKHDTYSDLDSNNSRQIEALTSLVAYMAQALYDAKVFSDEDIGVLFSHYPFETSDI
jgi:hypothetical protein